MVINSKKKAHRSCSCGMCVEGRARPYGQEVHKRNEKKLRRLAKQELQKAIRELPRDLEEIDVIGKINSPYTD